MLARGAKFLTFAPATDRATSRQPRPRRDDDVYWERVPKIPIHLPEILSYPPEIMRSPLPLIGAIRGHAGPKGETFSNDIVY